MGTPSVTPASTEPLGAAVRDAAELQQTGFMFGPDGTVAVTVEPASDRKRHHRGIRDDARRTSEYLASRGATAVEVLQDVMNTPIADLVRDLGCARWQAMGLKVSCAVNLLPYTAAKLAQVSLDPAALGSMALAHWLAAGAIRGPVSSHHQSVDGSQVIDAASERESLPEDIPEGDAIARNGLPPVGPD